VSKQNGDPVHTVYIGGIYEHHEKISSGSVTAENNFLHIMDDSRRVAIKRIRAHLDGTNPANIQYHLGAHLQSSSVVLDGSGNFFNREEYRPYGETSFGSYDKKRYRFTGQERDEESGLNYHGARYYAPWAAKWTAPDPKGMVDGPSVYAYSQSNPIRLTDKNGTEARPPVIDHTVQIAGETTRLRSTASTSETNDSSTKKKNPPPSILGALRQFASGVATLTMDLLRAPFAIPNALISGLTKIGQGIATVFAKGESAKKGFGQMGEGLLTMIQPVADPLLFFLGKTVSSIQTLLGIEPPGQDLEFYLQQREDISKEEIKKLKELHGEDFVENSNIQVKAQDESKKAFHRNGLFGFRSMVLGNTIYLNEGGKSLETVSHELQHIRQHRNPRFQRSAYITDALVGQAVEGYDFNRARGKDKEWDELNPEQRAQFIQRAFATNSFKSKWPGQGGSGKAMWKAYKDRAKFMSTF
jgi:RHS repeat-associated protein